MCAVGRGTNWGSKSTHEHGRHAVKETHEITHEDMGERHVSLYTGYPFSPCKRGDREPRSILMLLHPGVFPPFTERDHVRQVGQDQRVVRR